MKSALFTGAAVALGLILASTGSAQASPTPQPTAQARQHGISKAGDAYMGWTQNTTTSSSAAAPADMGTAATVEGIDVSSHQGNVDWAYWWGQGKRFAYVKATEGTSYKNPYFAQQYNGSYNVGMIRGAYHFALPNSSSGATQASYFASSGGGWSRDGKTLPGALDIEYNPYGDACYGKSPADMTNWIADFTRTYLAKEGRSALIYTSTTWWKRCTGNTNRFGDTDPLWLARYASQIGELPAGWDKQSIWQFSRTGGLPGDQNYYNGPFNRVQALASGPSAAAA